MLTTNRYNKVLSDRRLLRKAPIFNKRRLVDRRNSVRFITNMPVMIETKGIPRLNFSQISIKVKNINKEGMLAISDHLLPITSMTLSIEAKPNEPIVLIDSKVVRRQDLSSNKFAYGIRFAKIKNRAQFKAFINDLMGKRITFQVREGIRRRAKSFSAIRNNICGLRERANLSMEELAYKAGISMPHLSMLENQNINPADTLKNKFAKIFNRPADEITGDINNWNISVSSSGHEKSVLKRGFITKVKKFRNLLMKIKEECDKYDCRHFLDDDRIKYTKKVTKNYFHKFNEHFTEIWPYYLNLNIAEFEIHKRYYRSEIWPFFSIDSFSEYIQDMPLGYSGDFIVMDYLYNDGYIGDTTFAKVIHRYICSIPIARATIFRKEYFKDKIRKTFKRVDSGARISNVGCGPSRDVIEFLHYESLPKKYRFFCIDFEDLAIKHVKNEIESLERKKGERYQVEYVCKDILDLFRTKDIENQLKRQDLIYCAGLIDYLDDYLSLELIKTLYNLLRDGGELIIGNLSKGNPSRSCMEILGDWWINYRSRNDMIKLARRIDKVKDFNIEEDSENGLNLFLILKKPKN